MFVLLSSSLLLFTSCCSLFISRGRGVCFWHLHLFLCPPPSSPHRAAGAPGCRSSQWWSPWRRPSSTPAFPRAAPPETPRGGGAADAIQCRCTYGGEGEGFLQRTWCFSVSFWGLFFLSGGLWASVSFCDGGGVLLSFSSRRRHRLSAGRAGAHHAKRAAFQQTPECGGTVAFPLPFSRPKCRLRVRLGFTV